MLPTIPTTDPIPVDPVFRRTLAEFVQMAIKASDDCIDDLECGGDVDTLALERALRDGLGMVREQLREAPGDTVRVPLVRTGRDQSVASNLFNDLSDPDQMGELLMFRHPNPMARWRGLEIAAGLVSFLNRLEREARLTVRRSSNPYDPPEAWGGAV